MYLRKLHWNVISRYFEYIGHGSPSQSLCAYIKHDRWPSQNFCAIARKFSCSHVVSLFRRKDDVHVCVLRRPQNTNNIFNICPGPHCSSASLPSHIVTERVLTHLWPISPFYTPWKHPENQRLSGVFRGYKLRKLHKSGLIEKSFKVFRTSVLIYVNGFQYSAADAADW